MIILVIYFSKTGTTEKYAQVLAQMKSDSICELTSKNPSGGNVMGAIKSVFKREEPVSKMPDISNESTIYLCSPVWGGGFPPVMLYFVNHGDLKDKEIKLLTTSLSGRDEYLSAFQKQLELVGAKLSKGISFSSKQNPEPPKDQLINF